MMICSRCKKELERNDSHIVLTYEGEELYWNVPYCSEMCIVYTLIEAREKSEKEKIKK